MAVGVGQSQGPRAAVAVGVGGVVGPAICRNADEIGEAKFLRHMQAYPALDVLAAVDCIGLGVIPSQVGTSACRYVSWVGDVIQSELAFQQAEITDKANSRICCRSPQE